MADSLKDQNKLLLFVVMVVNLALLYGTIQTDVIFGGDWLAVARSLPEALPGGLGLILIGVINAQLSTEAKARIVFLRWTDALPGSEAFTRYAGPDPRIDLASIERAHGPLPSTPQEQNTLWYKLYKSVEADPSVVQVHREYLFTRDYNCLSLMMALVLGTVGFFQIPSVGTAMVYLGLLIVQFLLTGRAARGHGRRFVTTVLALKGAER